LVWLRFVEISTFREKKKGSQPKQQQSKYAYLGAKTLSMEIIGVGVRTIQRNSYTFRSKCRFRKSCAQLPRDIELLKYYQYMTALGYDSNKSTKKMQKFHKFIA